MRITLRLVKSSPKVSVKARVSVGLVLAETARWRDAQSQTTVIAAVTAPVTRNAFGQPIESINVPKIL